MVDNFLDISHFPWVHTGTFGSSQATGVTSIELVDLDRDDWADLDGNDRSGRGPDGRQRLGRLFEGHVNALQLFGWYGDKGQLHWLSKIAHEKPTYEYVKYLHPMR